MCVAGAIANFTSQLLHYRHGSADRRCKREAMLLGFACPRFVITAAVLLLQRRQPD